MTTQSPRLTVDGIVRSGEEILLIKRAFEPFKDCWALPGGFVEYGETVETAVVRELHEETGLEVVPTSIFGVYSNPKRDPRGHTITIVFKCDVIGGALGGDHEVQEIKYFPVRALPPMAFDHADIIHDLIQVK